MNICANFRSHSEVASYTGSPESFEFARQKFEQCFKPYLTNRHSSCKSNMYELPTRILEIQKRNGEYDVRLRASKGAKDKYVTLSHCWGIKPMFTTTRSTLAEREAGIPFTSMPRTFRDAVDITYGLGFRLLWIDALCILQGDKTDWQIESSKMHHVYQYCSVMISADDSKDGDGGCFNNNNQSLPWKVQPNWLSKTPVWVRLHKTHGALRSAMGLSPNDPVTRGPLADRAWAFQERALAPRILHYAGDELIWECRSTFGCQCGAINQEVYFECTIKAKLGKLHRPELLDANSWYDIIPEFSMRRLTVPTDRLPAMSGIAKLFQTTSTSKPEKSEIETTTSVGHEKQVKSPKFFPSTREKIKNSIKLSFGMKKQGMGQYLAGLWSGSLTYGMCWSANKQMIDELSEKPLQYIAPSWSWASVDHGKVQYAGSVATDITIVSFTCTPAGPDPTGEVSNGEITLTGDLARVLITLETCSSDTTEDVGYYTLTNARNHDISRHYFPDHILNQHDTHMAVTSGLHAYALILAPDMGLVVKHSSVKKGAFERIGSMAFGVEYGTPHSILGWDAKKHKITIV